MPSSTVRPPGRFARSTPPGAPGTATTSQPDPPRDPNGHGRRLVLSLPFVRWLTADLRIGLAVSVTLHLLFLALIALTDVVRVPDLEGLLAARAQAGEGGGARVVMIPIWPGAGAGARETASPVVAQPEPNVSVAPPVVPRPAGPGVTETGPPTATPAPVPSTGLPGQGVGGEGGPGRTATPATDRFTRALEALRPRLLDPRLRPGTVDALRTDEERAAVRAYARINALNDSILAVMERERRATDWTWTDEDGRRWGISPGKLHLGGVEIPLPLGFSPTPEQRERLREWEEIQAQSVQGEVDATFDDRVEAIREARDAERATP